MIVKKERFILQHKPSGLYVADEFPNEDLEVPYLEKDVELAFKMCGLEEVKDVIENICLNDELYNSDGDNINIKKEDFKAIIVNITEEYII